MEQHHRRPASGFRYMHVDPVGLDDAVLGAGGGGHAGYSALTLMEAQAISASLLGTRRPPLTACTLTRPCGSSVLTASRSTESGSGTATVTSTSMVPPRSRIWPSSGKLEWRIASETARRAAFVQS